MSTVDGDELLPWWMHRQSDPASPDVVIGSEVDHNTTHRSWTLLGTVGGSDHGVIDPRGLVTPRSDGFSIDWWVGADDRWHLPSRSVAVRQRLVDDSPVVETSMRVPGGEVLHRAWAVAAGEGVPAGGAIVIELHNASAVPVAVAFSVRPFNPIGRSRISRIDLADTVLVIDGRPSIHLPKSPSRVAIGSGASGDALAVVESGAAGAEWPVGGVHCAAGRASAALLFPLPHTASIRLLVPLGATEPASVRRRRSTKRSSAPVSSMISPAAAPDAARVVAGWDVQTRRCPRIELLERRGLEALRAARRFALLHAAGEDARSWTGELIDVFDSCFLILALGQQGLHAEATRLLLGLEDRIDVDGRFELEHLRTDAGAAWLCAVASQVSLADDAVLARSLVGDVAKVAHRVHHDVVASDDGRRSRRSIGPSWISTPGGLRVHELVWAHSGLLAAASALRFADQHAAADVCSERADALVGHVRAAITDAVDSRDASLAAVVALVESESVLGSRGEGHLDLLIPVASADAVRGAIWHRAGSAGLSPRLSAAVAIGRARIGDPDAVATLRWMLDIGEPTWSWPEFVHPRTGDGCGGDGHCPVSSAALLRLVRAMTVSDDADGIDLLPSVPPEWLGQPLEIHGLPTRHGSLSFALRWHGERPAILWELVPRSEPAIVSGAAGAVPFTLRCSGLDPDWSAAGNRGEALLAAPAASPAMSAEGSDDPGGSFA